MSPQGQGQRSNIIFFVMHHLIREKKRVFAIVYYRLHSCIFIVLSIFSIIKMSKILLFLKVKFTLKSIPTIYLSYNYSSVATNTKLDLWT